MLSPINYNIPPIRDHTTHQNDLDSLLRNIVQNDMMDANQDRNNVPDKLSDWDAQQANARATYNTLQQATDVKKASISSSQSNAARQEVVWHAWHYFPTIRSNENLVRQLAKRAWGSSLTFNQRQALCEMLYTGIFLLYYLKFEIMEWERVVSVVLPNVVANEEEEGISSNSSNENKKERIVFGGLLESKTKPLPADVSRNSLIKFFKEEQETNIILIASAGGNRATERISRTAELDEYWYQCCQDTYGQENLPSDSDPIYATNTTTRYPGLFQLTTTTYNGIKTFIPTNNDDDNNEMPRYDLLMIAEQQHPKGLPPVVWAFHKICGFCAGRDSLEPCGRVQGSVSIVKVNDSQYAFSFSVNIQIRIDFPKKLMKIMPMKKENAESLVSKVILKAISKDIDRNLDAFYDSFMKWFNDKPDGGGGESESEIEASAPDSASSRDENSEL